MNTLLVTPITTEKAFIQSQKNVYTFNVPMTANRVQIVDAIESQYGVSVKAVKIVIQNGKAVRFSRGKNRYPGTSSRSDSKKAYVTLVSGNTLPFFEQPVEEEKK